MRELGFHRLEADRGVYMRMRNGKVLILAIHVDDGAVTGDDDIDEFMQELKGYFEVKDLGDVRLFLGLLVTRDRKRRTITLDQRHQVTAILAQYGMSSCSGAVTPVESKPREEDDPTVDMSAVPYRPLLGALLYLAGSTRPEIAFAVHRCATHANFPRERDWRALKHVVRYIKKFPSLGLKFGPAGGSTMDAWCDADHGADLETRRSVTGYIFRLGGGAISWSSKKQATVAVSSTEAEYMAMSSAAREAIWLRSLLGALGFAQDGPTVIHGDNQGCISLARHPTSHQRTKHIAIHYHFTRERMVSGEIVLEWVGTREMLADIFTKGLPSVQHYALCREMGLTDVLREGECWSRRAVGAQESVTLEQ
jgi:hypothetical protein